MSPTEKILSLINNLPTKDIALANKLILERRFQDLYYIVKSDVYKVEKELQKEEPKAEYVNLDLEKLQELLTTVISYMNILDVDGSYNANMEDYE